MRIRDWSSDVCSSDLRLDRAHRQPVPDHLARDRLGALGPDQRARMAHRKAAVTDQILHPARQVAPAHQIRHMADRKSVVAGKSVSVRLDLGGRRSLKKKKINSKLCHMSLKTRA